VRWTKLKQITERRFAASVRQHVQVNVTRYRRAHDAEGRWAISSDGVEVGGIGCIVADQEEAALIERYQQASALTAPQAQVVADRALALLDSRLGRRRLERLACTTPATSLEAACLSFRLAADRIRPVAGAV
jgi:hypothetical protein